MKTRTLFFNAVCLLFITMFIYAAVSKWLDFDVFEIHMKRQPFPPSVTPFLIWGLPPTEVVVSILLMLDKTRSLGLKIATGMMVLFSGYILLAKMHFFGDIPCSCGGALTKLTWTQHLFFNLFFVIAGAIAILLMRKPYSTQN